MKRVFGSVGMMGARALSNRDGSLKNELRFCEAGLQIDYFNINFHWCQSFEIITASLHKMCFVLH